MTQIAFTPRANLLSRVGRNLRTCAMVRFLSAMAVAFRASRVYRSREIQAWIRIGTIGLSERIQGELSLETLAERVLEFLAVYLKARVGTIYLAEPDGGYRPLAHYLAGRPDREVTRRDNEFPARAAKHGRALYVSDMPRDSAPTELL